jgi:hypothetical protein
MDIFGQLSSIAAFAYIATSGVALVAATRAPGTRRKLAAFNWTAVAVIFVLLAVWRLGEGEARVQEVVRSWTRNHGVYDDRYSFQIPITLGAVLAVSGLVWLARRSSGAGQSGRALCVALVMGVFTAVRATSLHAVDAFLYESIGPIHVNYVIDLGLTALAGALALVDCGLLVTPAPPPPTPRRSSSRSRSSGSGSRQRDRDRSSDRHRP